MSKNITKMSIHIIQIKSVKLSYQSHIVNKNLIKSTKYYPLNHHSNPYSSLKTDDLKSKLDLSNKISTHIVFYNSTSSCLRYSRIKLYQPTQSSINQTDLPTSSLFYRHINPSSPLKNNQSKNTSSKTTTNINPHSLS